MEERIKAQLHAEKSNFQKQITIALLFIFICFWSGTTLDFSRMSTSGISIAKNIIMGILQPDMTFLFNATTSGVPYLLLETVCIAFLGTIVGAVFALPLAFLGAINIVPSWIAMTSRFFVMAVRTIPSFVYGLMFIRVTGPGPFAGVMTMSVCSIGMVSKMYIEAIEDLDIRILESLDALGYNLFQKIRYGIFPQLLPDFTSTMIYRFDMNLRDAIVLGLVGAGGIGAPLIFAINAYRFHEVGAILVGLILLILFIEIFSTKIRRKLTRGVWE